MAINLEIEASEIMGKEKKTKRNAHKCPLIWFLNHHVLNMSAETPKCVETQGYFLLRRVLLICFRSWCFYPYSLFPFVLLPEGSVGSIPEPSQLCFLRSNCRKIGRGSFNFPFIFMLKSTHISKCNFCDAKKGVPFLVWSWVLGN